MGFSKGFGFAHNALSSKFALIIGYSFETVIYDALKQINYLIVKNANYKIKNTEVLQRF